jgi:hypothetical protein
MWTLKGPGGTSGKTTSTCIQRCSGAGNDSRYETGAWAPAAAASPSQKNAEKIVRTVRVVRVVRIVLVLAVRTFGSFAFGPFAFEPLAFESV